MLPQELPPSGKLLDDEDGLFTEGEHGGGRPPVSQADIAPLVELFEDAKTFGSLIQVPPKLAEKLPRIEQRLRGCC